jgi:hypothetical protein
MTTRIQLRRDTALRWASVNPVLAAGEPALESDTGQLKMGDGTSAWSALPYFLDVADLTPVLQQLVAAAIPPGMSTEQVRDIIGATVVGDGDFIVASADDAGDVVRLQPGASLTDLVSGLADAAAAISTKQDAGDYATLTDLSAGLGAKVNSSTYTAGLATKQDAATLATDMASHVSDGSAFAVAQRAAFVPKWKPNTAYTAGDPVVNPSGQLVTANTSFTSGATYNAANWTVTAGGAGGSVSDASASAKGVVQLAGDLGGTAASPTVPGLAGRLALSGGTLTGDVISADGSKLLSVTDGNSRYQPVFGSAEVLLSTTNSGAAATANVTALNNAISAMSTAGGGTVTVSLAGTYYLNDHILMRSNVTLRSAAGVIYKKVAGATLNVCLLRNANLSVTRAYTDQNIVVDGGVWDGNYANNSTSTSPDPTPPHPPSTPSSTGCRASWLSSASTI